MHSTRGNRYENEQKKNTYVCVCAWFGDVCDWVYVFVLEHIL